MTWLRGGDSGLEAALVPSHPDVVEAPVGWPRWSVSEARPKLGELVRQAAGGRPVVLTRHGRPVAVLDSAGSPLARPPAAPLGALLDGLPLTPDLPAAEVPVPTGLPGLDEVTAGGLRPGRLAVLTAPPGVGATTLALGMARAVALGEQPYPVLVVSGRLTQRDVLVRVLAAEAGVKLRDVAAGTLPDGDRNRVGGVAARLRAAPLHLADQLTTLDQVRAAAERIEGLALVVLDPIGHLDLAGSLQPPLALRRLARDLHTAVLAITTPGARGVEELTLEADLALRLDREGADARVVLAVERHRHGLTGAWPLRADFARAGLLPVPAGDDAGPGTGASGDHGAPGPSAATAASIPSPTGGSPVPVTHTAPRSVPPAAATATAAVAVATPDRLSDGTVVTATVEPCVLCGEPTPYRAAGHPQHLGGLCVTNTVPPPVGSPAAAAPAQDGTASAPAGVAARPQRRREETGGLIAQAVAQALEDNGGDMDAALAVLIKRAIPDAMALLNSTRVGSTYDFTNYLTVDDVPILKKPSRDGADLIWEGRPKWRNRAAEAGPRRTATALDVNGAYLSALKTHLPIGTLRHSTDGVYDRKRSGVYLVDPPAWAHEDLPNPLGNREEPGPLWITDPTLRLLIRLSGRKYGLCAAPVIHESWTSGSSEALLEKFRRELATARDTALENGDRVTLEYVKAMYAKFVSTIGESSANREMRRPDWMHIIRSQAFANLWLKAWKAHQAGLTIVRMTGTDELHLTGGDWRQVFTEGRRLTDMKFKNEYPIGRGDDD